LTELEKIGLIPRSIVRMLDRFYYQIYLGTAEPLVKQFRFSKYLLLTSVKSLFVVLFIPFFINIFTKIYIFRPLVEYFWDTKQTEIFLNYELQEKAFTEIRNFEEKIYFDYLLKIPEDFVTQSFALRFERRDEVTSLSNSSFQDPFFHESGNKVNLNSFVSFGNKFPAKIGTVVEMGGYSLPIQRFTELSAFSLYNSYNPFLLRFIEGNTNFSYGLPASFDHLLIFDKSHAELGFSVPQLFSGPEKRDAMGPFSTTFVFSSSFSRNEKRSFSLQEPVFRQKTRELAEHYNKESISALTNLLADFMGLIILFILLVNMKMSLMNTTAFLSESFFSLKDSKKAFLMLLFTDLLVGFHSPRGWEVIFHFLFEHFGLPENHNIIFLLVGTFPVLLDALFKYWIFRHLNRHSPATVATFQAMVE